MNNMKNTRTNNSPPGITKAQTGVPGAKSRIPASQKSVIVRTSGTPAEDCLPMTTKRSSF